MNDENGSANGGQPGGDGAAGGNGGGAAPWYAMEGMAPEQATQLGELVKTKGWKHPGEALLSYANLERVFGADKAGRTILAPKGDDDAEGWNALYDRLGRPKTPDEYELPVPEGDDGAFAKVASTWLHEAGVPKRQAQLIASKWNEFSAALEEQQAKDFQAQTERDYAALKGEWGAAAAQNEEMARRAVAQFGQEAGLDAEGLTKLEKAIGTGPMLKLFNAIGSKFAEGTFVGGNAPAGYKMTPAQAQAEITKKFSDTEFMDRYMNQDEKIRKVAIEEMAELQRQAHPELQQ